MNPAVEQIVNNFKQMPVSRKVIIAVVTVLVVAGFSSLFFLANKTSYQPVFANMTSEDAAEAVTKLKELKIQYKLGGAGATILVPADRVYDVRLKLAEAGLPKGGGVGFEIFDKTDFGTTEFVQKLNYKRALQGELARTIREFSEVIDARVMIVLPKESVFVEEEKPPSASVLLKLRSVLDKGKIDAVVHLVASAIEELTPDLVTVVDTKGNVLSKGTPEEEAEVLANTQLEYKMAMERTLTRRIQSMLERIVGQGKAIVRVTTDMDFSQVDVNEEIYDPDVQVVRSRQNIVETTDKRNAPAKVSTVNPIVPEGDVPNEITENKQRTDDTVNYEISKTIRKTVLPMGAVRRLSVAAVLDGTYEIGEDDEGDQVRKYVPRTPEELLQFEKIVKQAMGFNADREDQVSVESFAFSTMDDMGIGEAKGIDWLILKKEYGRVAANLLLVFLLFLFVVRPILKTVKDIYAPDEEPDLGLPEADIQEEVEIIPPKPKVLTIQEKAIALAREDVEKTSNIIRGWLAEAL
jgi:flagellar M-ring protein FliF